MKKTEIQIRNIEDQKDFIIATPNGWKIGKIISNLLEDSLRVQIGNTESFQKITSLKVPFCVVTNKEIEVKDWPKLIKRDLISTGKLVNVIEKEKINII